MPLDSSLSNDTLTPIEVAHMLRIAKNTVYELVKRGELPVYRAGKLMRFNIKDVQEYQNKGRSTKTEQPPSLQQKQLIEERNVLHQSQSLQSTSDSVILCGQDVLLDILAHHLESKIHGLRATRSYLGSYNGLHELYMGNVHLASSHLWDADTNSYTLPFLPHLLPGIPLTVVRLVRRMVGFYVPKGNPKKISCWDDLGRSDLTLINRELGSGIRVLLDGKLRKAGISTLGIPGYNHICTTHLVAATTVARGGGDYAIGSEIAGRQVAGISFIPLQEECYDLVFPTAHADLPHFQALIERIQSVEFKAELKGLGGYETSETGKILLG